MTATGLALSSCIVESVRRTLEGQVVTTTRVPFPTSLQISEISYYVQCAHLSVVQMEGHSVDRASSVHC
jgi:hypothetical protein